MNKWKESQSEIIKTPNPNYTARRIMAAGAILVAGGVGGVGVHVGLDALRPDKIVVDNYGFTLGSGETVVGDTSKALDEISKTNGINRGKLNGTSAAQDAATEMKSLTGEAYNQSGETYKITVRENGFGDEQVSVEPVVEVAP